MLAAARSAQREHRSELLVGLRGRVLELGAGNGANFEHYPATVTEVVAVEPEAYLRRRAERSAARAPVPVSVVDAQAGRLPFGPASFDGAVASLVLCSVPDPEQALRELFDLIRPGGELRFYEHVRAEAPALATLQRAADVVWPHLFGGCHTHRDTVGAIASAGFDIEDCRRFAFPACRLGGPTRPHVLGRGRRLGEARV